MYSKLHFSITLVAIYCTLMPLTMQSQTYERNDRLEARDGDRYRHRGGSQYYRGDRYRNNNSYGYRNDYPQYNYRPRANNYGLRRGGLFRKHCRRENLRQERFERRHRHRGLFRF